MRTVELDTTPGMAHWNVRLAALRECMRKGIVRLPHIAGGNNCADALTKRLPTPTFQRHADRMLGRPAGTPTTMP